FARKGDEDLALLGQFGWDRAVGLGVVDVKTDEVEPADLIATRITRALEVVPAERLIVNPDCGLRHLRPDVARAKLRAMVDGTAAVRGTLEPATAAPARAATATPPSVETDQGEMQHAPTG
ncbi:MAG: 5-methyltetrahydropteroyltriglutamate--homocysteine S-methyltransferase, partial [Solirubrobacterales bacterium]|nr:5-methyltetrahydropteroyltriglutamate--homocysteine S-methyltransferase [Solirubrobacterales bacterium]